MGGGGGPKGWVHNRLMQFFTGAAQKSKFPKLIFFDIVTTPYTGHEATENGLAYAPVSQAHGHNHIVQCFSSLHCSADQFCTTPGGC